MKQNSPNKPLTFLRRLTVAIAVLPAVGAVMIDSPVPGATRVLVTLLWVLSLVPAYLYFATPSNRRRPLPFVPAVSLVYGLYYAFPLTVGGVGLYEGAPVDPRWDYELPVQLAFFGWICMIAGYVALGLFFRDDPASELKVRKPSRLAAWALLLLYGSIGVVLLRAYSGGVLTSGGTYQFLISLQWIGGGLLMILARRKELSVVAGTVGFLGLLLAALLMLSIGSLAPLAMFLVVIGFGVWIGRPSIHAAGILAALVLMLTATTLRGVVADFRQTAWFGSEQLSPTQRVGLMLGLLQKRIVKDGLPATVAHGIVATASRSSNLDLFANVVRRTPSEVPYWNGETYYSLVGSFIPRVLWPDKPRKVLGQAFGHRYSYIKWSNTGTAINFPVLVEFYANFAIAGVILGMLVVGSIYRVLDGFVNRPGQAPLVSMFGAVLLLPLLIIESDFSLVFGGIPLNAAALYAVWRIIGRQPGAAQRKTSLYQIPALNRREVAGRALAPAESSTVGQRAGN